MKYLTLLMLLTLTTMVHAQEEEKDQHLTYIIDATYDSKSELGYRFIKRLDGMSVVFAQIEPRLLEFFNLDDDSLVGSTFRITYFREPNFPDRAVGKDSIPVREDLIISDLVQIE
ncbi:hypothetical protein [Flagellimonas beolgyonensis]|uniref:hypothetical protein n=1 Tax=Flagellimonas beolgyonensis TaxID=864064 RepID=UPI003D650866